MEKENFVIASISGLNEKRRNSFKNFIHYKKLFI